MAISKKSTWASIDWMLVFLYLSLCLIGWLMLYSAEFDPQQSISFLDLNHPLVRQTIWILAAITFFWLLFLIDEKFWNTFAYVIYIVSIIFLLVVLVFGTTKKGSTSWLVMFGFSFQPAEFAKLGTTLALANYLSYYKTQLKKYKSQLVSLMIVTIPAVLILVQPDAGSALAFLSLSIMMYRGGLSPLWLIVLFALAALFVLSLLLPLQSILVLLMAIAVLLSAMPLIPKMRNKLILAALVLAGLFTLWNRPAYLLAGLALIFAYYLLTGIRRRTPGMQLASLLMVIVGFAYSFSTNYVFDKVLQPHQQDRINVWLMPEKSDPQGSMYNVLQSKVAIGSGGLQGKGYLNGTLTKLNYVPEQTTDFIFSIIGEEQGFLGSLGIIVIYLLLLYRITVLGERMRNAFHTYFAYGLAGFIFLHVLVNIGMSMGILPVIGIPLPFISKGGSSFLMFSIMLSILVKMDSKRRVTR
jgi:rod shape determining protein RodA